MKKSIKFLIGFYCLIIVICILLSILFYSEEKTQVIKNNKAQLFLKTEATVEVIRYIFDDFITELEILKKTLYEVKNTETVGSHLIQFFRIILTSSSFLNNIYYADKHGDVTVVYPHTVKKSFKADLALEKHFIKTKDKKITLLSDLINTYKSIVYGSTHYAVLFSPLYDKNKIFEGIIGADIDLKKISSIIQPFNDLKTKDQFKNVDFYCLTSAKALVFAGPQNVEYGAIPSFIPKDKIESFLSRLKKNNYIINDLIQFGNSKYYITTVPYTLYGKKIIVMGVKTYIGSIETLRTLYYKISIMVAISIIIIIIITVFILKNEKRFALFKQKYKTLEIFIDEQKKKGDVEDLVTTDYFKQIKEKMDEINDICK